MIIRSILRRVSSITVWEIHYIFSVVLLDCLMVQISRHHIIYTRGISRFSSMMASMKWTCLVKQDCQIPSDVICKHFCFHFSFMCYKNRLNEPETVESIFFLCLKRQNAPYSRIEDSVCDESRRYQRNVVVNWKPALNDGEWNGSYHQYPQTLSAPFASL